MSGNRAIDPLPLQDFPAEADTSDPGFEQLFRDLVGDAGTPADGFEAVLADALALLDSLDTGLAALGGQTGGALDDAFADILAIDPAPAGEDIKHLAAAVLDIDFNVTSLGSLLAGAALPTPTSGTGAGINLTLAPGTSLPCQEILNFPTADQAVFPFNQQIYLGNPTSSAMQIIAMRLVQITGTEWSATTGCAQGTLNPGDQCQISITCNTAPAPGDSCELQVDTDIYGTLVLCAAATGSTGISTGGGGIGSGPPGKCGGAGIIRHGMAVTRAKRPQWGFCA